MRVAEQASRSNKFAVFWVADNIIILFLDLEGYVRKLALRTAWPCFGNSTVLYNVADTLARATTHTAAVARVYRRSRKRKLSVQPWRDADFLAEIQRME
jgi:cellulose synthase/poly-beta-1,6-N-acetylglucosamine synthase-like glycosyltransferase